MLTLIIFGTLFLLMAIGAPIAVSLGLASIGGLLYSGLNLEVVAQKIVATNSSFPLLAVPFFILAGEIMATGGMSRRLVRFVSALVGHLTGGLAAVSIVGSGFFAALSGSNAATVAAIGGVMTGPMREKGYRPEYTAATIATAGTLGMIIPPSILMILYGVVANASIPDLFLAGVLPGVLILIALLALNRVLVTREKIEPSPFAGWREVMSSFRSAILPLLMPVIILGGIYGGIFTPTESAVVAVAYGIIVGFIFRELGVASIWTALRKTVVQTAVVMFILNCAGLFAWVITINQIPQSISAWLEHLTGNVYVYLLLVNIFLIGAGCIMNGAAAIVIFAAILVPAAQSFGIDPVVFGVIMVVNLSIGTVTPPLGVDLFIASSITGIPIERIIRASIPHIFTLIACLIIITYVPWLSTALIGVWD